MSGTETDYQHALTLHRAGDLSGARERYLHVLKADPDHARAMHRLGIMDLRDGRLDDARRLLGRAIELEPSLAGLHNSFGNLLRAQGKLDEALAAYREELRQRPDFAVPHHQVGLLFMEMGQLDNALRAVKRAIFHAPDFAAGYNTLGRIYNNLGQLAEARQAFARARHFDPDSAEIVYNLGHVTRRMGEHDQAGDLFRTALQLDPAWQPAHRQLGQLMFEQGEPASAAAHFEQALALDENDPFAQFGLGLILQQRSQWEAARARFARATALSPGYADAHCNLAAVLRSLGELEQSERHFRKALDLDAGLVPALSGLAGVLEMQGRFEAANALLSEAEVDMATPELLVIRATVLQRLDRANEAISLLQTGLAQTGHSDFDRMVLHFKLGDLLDATQRYEAAFEQFSAGNALRTGAAGFQPERHRSGVERVVAAFSRQAMARLPRSTSDSEVPIFIIGMPRSGTSLIEQILATHPQVHGAGELGAIAATALGLPALLQTQKPYPECVSEATPEALTTLAAQYLGQLTKRAPAAARITDKMWQNYEQLGLIELLFPRARVIHCLRDPRDSLLSCYFHLFGGGGIPFSYDPDNLLTAYKAYRTLMKHWRKVLGLAMLEMRYEELVADSPTQIRRLVEFAGLPWDDACLRFHDNRRGVATASYDQVRQPVYDKSVGRHKHYQPWLDTWFKRIQAVS